MENKNKQQYTELLDSLVKGLLDEIKCIIVSCMLRSRAPSLVCFGAKMLREVLRLRSLIIDFNPPTSIQVHIESSLKEILRDVRFYADDVSFAEWPTAFYEANDTLIRLRIQLGERRARSRTEFDLAISWSHGHDRTHLKEERYPKPLHWEKSITKQPATNLYDVTEGEAAEILVRNRWQLERALMSYLPSFTEKYLQEVKQIAPTILPTRDGDLSGNTLDIKKLLEKLLGIDQSRNIGCLSILGVTGSEGTGKTTLLFRIMMDALLRASNLVIFAELPDKEPTDEDLMLVQASMVLQLGVEEDHKGWKGFNNLDVGRDFLKASLKRATEKAHRPLLIAIDNVWRAQDLKRLLPEGVDMYMAPCVFAITSSHQGMVEALQQIISGKEKQRVPVFIRQQKPLERAASMVLSLACTLQAGYYEVDKVIRDQSFLKIFNSCGGTPGAIRQLIHSVLTAGNASKAEQSFVRGVMWNFLEKSLRRVEESAQRALVEIVALGLDGMKWYQVGGIVGDVELEQLKECNLVNQLPDYRFELASCYQFVILQYLDSYNNWGSIEEDVQITRDGQLRGFEEASRQLSADRHLHRPQDSSAFLQNYLQDSQSSLKVMHLKYLNLNIWKRYIHRGASFASMTNLVMLKIRGDFEFIELTFPKSLRHIEILNNYLNLIELSKAQLPVSLTFFKLEWCKSLSELPESIYACTNLRGLVLRHCRRLQAHGFLKNSTVWQGKLEELDIIACPSLNLNSDSMQYLCSCLIRDCKRLSLSSGMELSDPGTLLKKQPPAVLRRADNSRSARLENTNEEGFVIEQQDNRTQDQVPETRSRMIRKVIGSDTDKGKRTLDISGQGNTQTSTSTGMLEMTPTLYPSPSAGSLSAKDKSYSVIVEEENADSVPVLNDSSKPSAHHEITSKQRPSHEDTQEPLRLHSDLQKLTLKDRDLEGFMSEEVPNLTKLKLHYCWSFESLPHSILNLHSLQVLKLHGCSRLQELPVEMGTLTALESLEVHGCEKLKRLPESLSRLTLLEELSLCECSALEALPDTIGELSALKILRIAGCENLSRLPDSTSKLVSLVQLELQGCSMLTELPREMGYLSNLHAHNWLRPRTRRQLELKVLSLDDCTSFGMLPRKLGNFKNLRTMSLAHCVCLEALSSGICNLQSLVFLDLQGCSELQKLPGKFGIHLMSLEALYLMDCQSLKGLPNNFCKLKGLTELDMTGCTKVEWLPQQMGSLKALRKLKLAYCKSLRELPDSICELGALVVMDVHGCYKLGELPAKLGKLGKLEILDLRNCESLMRFPHISGDSELQSLKELDLRWSHVEILAAEKGDLYFLGPDKVRNFFEAWRKWSTKPDGRKTGLLFSG